MSGDQDLKRRLHGLKELGSLVRSLKLLSAASMHRFERAAAGLGESVEILERGLSLALQDRALPDWSQETEEPLTAGIVLGSDHGLCGAYHESLTDFVRRTDPVPVPLLAVGSRLASALSEAGVQVDAERPGITTLQALAPAVQDLLSRLEEWSRVGVLQRLVVIHQRPAPGGPPHPVRLRLLPVDPEWLREVSRRPWTGSTLPWCPQPAARLLPGLLRQHLFLTLYRACAEALAAENAARFHAMQAAERNLDEKLRELTRRDQRLRQERVTEGVLEVLGGFEACQEESAGRRCPRSGA